MPLEMDNLGLLSSLPFQNVLLPCSPLMYSALMMASLYGCRCFMCKKNGLKRSMTNCESQSNDFALTKCRRLDHDSSSLCPLNDANSGRKCAGTQTLFSSFVPVPNFYQQPPADACSHDANNEEEPRFILDLDRHMARSSQLLHEMRRLTPPSLETESSNTPLNLTLSSSSKSSLRSPPVNNEVQCGQWTISRDRQYAHPNDGSGFSAWNSDERDLVRSGAKEPDFCKNSRLQAPTPHKIWALTHDTRPNTKTKQRGNSPRKVTSVVTTECERDIEEHFQRSLGKDYPKFLAKDKQNVCNTEPAAPTGAQPVVLPPDAPTRQNSAIQTPSTSVPESSEVDVTVSGAVDDHFAKSLGQTWTKIKSQNCQTDFKSPQPGSVDDHFAKALGETWYKLRVKKEGT